MSDPIERIKKQQKEMKETLKSISHGLNNLEYELTYLRKENRTLKTQIEELKQEKHNLMKIAMKTSDSNAFPEIAHYIYFALIEVLNDNSLSDEEKVNCLKIYLKPSLDKDTHQALYYVEEFKQEHSSFESVLNELISWIKFSYKLS